MDCGGVDGGGKMGARQKAASTFECRGDETVEARILCLPGQVERTQQPSVARGFDDDAPYRWEGKESVVDEVCGFVGCNRKGAAGLQLLQGIEKSLAAGMRLQGFFQALYRQVRVTAGVDEGFCVGKGPGLVGIQSQLRCRRDATGEASELQDFFTPVCQPDFDLDGGHLALSEMSKAAGIDSGQAAEIAVSANVRDGRALAE